MDINLVELERSIEPILRKTLETFEFENHEDSTHGQNDRQVRLVTKMFGWLVLEMMIQYSITEVNSTLSPPENPKPREIPFGEAPETGCLERPLVEMLGEGAFGRVFAIDDKRVVKIIPISTTVNKWTPLVSTLRDKFDNEVAMARRAGEISVGPKVYSSFFCKSRFDTTYGIIEMERVHGEMLNEWKIRKSPSELKDMKAKLDKKIKLMHMNSLFHNDLHEGNVIVCQDEPIIVDYGLSCKTKECDVYRYDDSHKHGDFFILENVEIKKGQKRRNARANVNDAIIRDVLKKALDAGVFKITF